MALFLVVVLLIVCGSGGALGSSNDTDCFACSDVVFIIDGSVSLALKDFNNEKDFVRSMVRRFRLGQNKTRVGLVQFSSTFSVSVFLDQGHNISVLDQALTQMDQLKGLTNTGRALTFAATHVFSNSSRSKVLVLITDGYPSDRVGPAVEKLKSIEVQTFVVGFNLEASPTMLTIASSPCHSFFVSSSESLHDLPQRLCSSEVHC